MDLKKFGEQLRALRKKAGFTQEQFIDQLQQIAAAGPADEYRVINASLVSRWESAHEHHGRFWKPTRQYVIYLAH
ncbi:MAG: helix-turn-helix domain-containing protein, partial [Anaerolineae bacterium]|nr:helix-turn-helix domain-containing protein [Anaerolineae bacterium]